MNHQGNMSLLHETTIRIERLLARERSMSSEPSAHGSQFSNTLALVNSPRRPSAGGPSPL